MPFSCAFSRSVWSALFYHRFSGAARYFPGLTDGASTLSSFANHDRLTIFYEPDVSRREPVFTVVMHGYVSLSLSISFFLSLSLFWCWKCSFPGQREDLKLEIQFIVELRKMSQRFVSKGSLNLSKCIFVWFYMTWYIDALIHRCVKRFLFTKCGSAFVVKLSMH